MFEQAYRRYDCRVFVVDNLMTVQNGSKDDYYHAQADFTIKLRKFAEKLGVAVHLVVHPRKTNGKNVTDNDDVGGLSTITNIACAVFSMQRVEDGEMGCNAVLSCTKNRAYGQLGDVRLRFIETSRRFVQLGEKERPYGWQKDDWTDVDEEPPF